MRLFDVISLNETKIDENTPDPFNSKFYNIIRRDRTSSGGDVMIFIKNEYKVINQYESSDFEIIFFQLKINETVNNFICAYNPHKEYSKQFFEYLETKFLMTMDLTLNFFLIGDLNNDLIEEKGNFRKVDLSTVIS